PTCRLTHPPRASSTTPPPIPPSPKSPADPRPDRSRARNPGMVRITARERSTARVCRGGGGAGCASFSGQEPGHGPNRSPRTVGGRWSAELEAVPGAGGAPAVEVLEEGHRAAGVAEEPLAVAALGMALVVVVAGGAVGGPDDAAGRSRQQDRK